MLLHQSFRKAGADEQVFRCFGESVLSDADDAGPVGFLGFGRTRGIVLVKVFEIDFLAALFQFLADFKGNSSAGWIVARNGR